MPIKKGRSAKIVSGNIKELVGTFKQSGKIGTSHPANKKAAVKQAVAIALSEARKKK